MKKRITGAILAVVAFFLVFTIAYSAPGDLTRTNATGGNATNIPAIPGTPCWKIGSQVFRPAGTPFSVCTPATTTTTLLPTTTSTSTTSTTSTTTLPTTTTTIAPPVGSQFVETFDTQDGLNRFVWTLTDGRSFFTQEGVTWNADHDLNCGAPTTSRTLSGPNDGQPYAIPMRFNPVVHGQVYWCPNGAGHMMSSFKTEGYGHIDFMPNQIFNNVTEVCWDVNATDLGHRKWIQVTVVPEAEFQLNGAELEYVHPGFGGPGGPAQDWSLPVRNGTFMFSSTQGSIEVFPVDYNSYSKPFGGNTDKATRLSTCLTDLGSSVRITRQMPNGSTETTTIPGATFPNGQSRVIFQDATYNPDKSADEGDPAAVANPYTWHWDNLIVR